MELMLPDDRPAISADRLDEVARLPIAAVVDNLVEIVGLKRTALIGNVKDTRLVQNWVRGEREPLRAEALRTGLQAARIVADSEGPQIAQAWFTGCNQHLEAMAPALALRDVNTPEVFTAVVRAAFAFVHQ
jgi:hypothetical protein